MPQGPRGTDVWEDRLRRLEGGYSAIYNAERAVDERLLRPILESRPPGLALDVGTLYPETPRLLAERGWRVVCVDLTEEVCHRVAAIARERGLSLLPVCCDANALPFRAGVFDLVTDLATSVVTPDALRVVSEEVRVAAPGGTYVLVTNNRWSRPARENLRRQAEAGGRHPRWGHFSPLSPLDLWRVARRHGLKLLRIDSAAYESARVGRWLHGIARRQPWLKRLLGWRIGAVYAVGRGQR